MEWLLRFVTWKSSVKGVLARRSEPLTATRKVRWKEVKGVIFALNLLETWRGSVGLPVAVYLAPDPPGDGSFSSPWNHFLGAYLAMSSCYALKAKLPLRGELRSALTARAAVASCACERWLRGMKGSGFVQLRCMEVYRGYSRYWSDSIWGSINGCLWRLWIDLPINCWVEVCTFFSCDCAADSVQWSFEVILSDIRSLNESYRLSQTDPGFDHPENPEWGELALSWYASVSERVGKSSEPILEWERRPCSTSYKTIRLPQKTSINFYKP